MKAYELLTNKSSAYIAKATSKGYDIKIRIKRSNKNTPNTFQAEIKVIAKDEKWMQCHWFDCRESIDSVINAISTKFSHISFEKEIKTVNKRNTIKKAKTTKKEYYIKKVNAEEGQATTIKTSKPLFEIA